MKWYFTCAMTFLSASFVFDGALHAKEATYKASQASTLANQPKDSPSTNQQPITPIEALPGPVQADSRRSDTVSQPIVPSMLSVGDQNRVLSEKINRLQESIEKLAKKSEDSTAWSTKDYASFLGPLVAAAAVIFSYRAVSVGRSMTLMQTRQNVNNERAKMLQLRLDTFYGPLVQLRNTSNLLYDIFRSRQQDPLTFRTLTALLSGQTFKGNDKVLLDEIIKIGEETEVLILKASGYVDEDIQELLGKATTHYRVLRLAHKGAIQGEPEKFREHVYPRELDASITAKIYKIQGEISKLTNVEANGL